MQRLAGELDTFLFKERLSRPDFDITNYLEQLKKSRNGSSALMRLQGGNSAVQGFLFENFDNPVDHDTLNRKGW